MLWHTSEGINPNKDEAHTNKLGIFLYSFLLVYTDSRLSRGDTRCISMVGVPSWYMGKAPKELGDKFSNSSIGAPKLVCKFDQATLGTPESSVVSTPLPVQLYDPNSPKDEGEAKVCLELFKVFYHSFIYTFFQDFDIALPSLTPSQSIPQSPLQLLSGLVPEPEFYLPEAKPDVI